MPYTDLQLSKRNRRNSQLSQVVLHELLKKLLYYQSFLCIQHNHLENLQLHSLYVVRLIWYKRCLRYVLNGLQYFSIINLNLNDRTFIKRYKWIARSDTLAIWVPFPVYNWTTTTRSIILIWLAASGAHKLISWKAWQVFYFCAKELKIGPVEAYSRGIKSKHF